MEYSFQALGTTWWIEIFTDVPDQTRDEVKNFVTGFVNKYENNYSRFKSDSMINILNHEREFNNPSKEFVDLLNYGKQLFVRTDTFFNLLTGHINEGQGYNQDYTFTTTDTPINWSSGNPVTDLEITADHIQLRGHANIDLGGYGKGYLIDLLATELITTLNLPEFLINGGGDIYATHHGSEAIEIHLEHPINHGSFIAPTKLHNQGFAASSPHKRVWQNSTGTHNHIVANQITTDATFIKAATAADADAFATTILQLDKAKIESLAQHENLAVARFDATTSMLTTTKNFN